MSISQYEGVPEIFNNETTELDRRHIIVTNQIMKGKTNNVGEITLVSGTATTTSVLSSGQLGPNTFINFMPTTANAATEYASGNMFVSTVDPDNNLFRITHSSAASGDRIFKFILVG